MKALRNWNYLRRLRKFAQPLRDVNVPDELMFLAPYICADMVRIGRVGDGGYCLPESVLKTSEHLLSFGVAADWSFEQDCVKTHSSPPPHFHVHSYDPTLWTAVNEKVLKSYGFKASLYIDYFLFYVTGRTAKHFYEFIGNGKDGYTPFRTVIERTDAKRILIKCDIEGGEYELIDDLLTYSDRIDCLMIEFHSLAARRQEFIACMNKLMERYDIVHLHANNCGFPEQDGFPDVVEITLVRKNLCTYTGKRTELPVPNMDFKNTPRAQDYRLIF